jgi:hypothetical protein
MQIYINKKPVNEKSYRLKNKYILGDKGVFNTLLVPH